MKRLLGVLAGVAVLMLLMTGNVWADYGFGTSSGGSDSSAVVGGFSNTVFKQTPDPYGAESIVNKKISDGYTSYAISTADNSVDPYSYKYAYFTDKSISDISYSVLKRIGVEGSNWGQYYKESTTMGAIADLVYRSGDTTQHAGLIRFQYDESSDSIIISTSTDGGKTWKEELSAPAISYADLTGHGQNTEAEVDSRQEKAKLSSRMTTQMVATRVMHVFSSKPRNKSVAPKQLSANLFQSGYTESGLSSGSNEDYGIGVWGMGAYAASDRTKSGSKSESNVGVFMLGIDKLLMDDKIAAGIGMSYENSWSKIKESGSTYDGNGFAVSPYLAYRITDSLTLRGVFNAAFNSYDANEGDDYDGTRLMGDISGEYTWLLNNWLLAIDMGYMYMNEDFNHSYEDVYLNEGRVGGKVGYSFSNGLLPYFKATFYQDLGSSSASSDEDSSYEGAVGLDYRINSCIVSLEAFDNFNNDRNTFGGSAMLRYEF